jgi:hypothetical protein
LDLNNMGEGLCVNKSCELYIVMNKYPKYCI